MKKNFRQQLTEMYKTKCINSRLFVQTRTLRKYPKNNAAHVLGYIGEVNNSIIEKNSYYKSGDYIGKSGLELAYEELLRGKRGVRKILVDVHNREKGSYNNGLEDTLSVAGQTIYSSLDVDLQAYGEFLMQNKTGSVVAIEPQTGKFYVWFLLQVMTRIYW